MTFAPSGNPGSFSEILAAVRAGSTAALGQLLSECRSYLLLVANRQLANDLQSKVSPSDLVQETFLDAQRDFVQFQGRGEDELLAWLTRILVNNLANANRRYRATAMRAVGREQPLLGADGVPLIQDVARDTPTPSQHAAAREQAERLDRALRNLPENYRRAVELRYREGLEFAAIGAVLGCSAEAARKLWARAVRQLREELDSSRES